MSTEKGTSENDGGPSMSQEELMGAMFANMVFQNTNMAMMFLGKMPNPQTGKTEQDLDHARYFIDLLEMIAFKTKGNLSKQEEGLLMQSLTHLRMTFVEAVEHPAKVEPPTDEPPGATSNEASPPSPPVDEQETPVAEPALPGEKTVEPEESKKRFTKKY